MTSSPEPPVLDATVERKHVTSADPARCTTANGDHRTWNDPEKGRATPAEGSGADAAPSRRRRAVVGRPAAALARRPWIRVAGTMFAVAWGGNEFTPLLGMYRGVDGLSAVAVNLMLAAYVVGIVPALLLGGPLSDRWGRRPLMLPASVLGALGSAVLALGGHSPALLYAGRVLSGMALGLAMAVGTSWVRELSAAPFDARADAGAGARRASIALTAGFGLGAGTAAALAQFGPLPTTLPYALNIALTATLGLLLLRAPESRTAPSNARSLWGGLRVPAVTHRRFLFVVVPVAPWVFGVAGCAYAALPLLMVERTQGFEIGFSGLLCLVALGCGVAVQALARRVDHPRSARAVVLALAVTIPGMLLAVLAAATLSIALTVTAAAVLGAAYGLLLVSGLREIQRIARPDEAAGLTAVYYCLTYQGFFVPAILAALSTWVTYPAMFTAGAVAAALCLGVVLLNRGRHLAERVP